MKHFKNKSCFTFRSDSISGEGKWEGGSRSDTERQEYWGKKHDHITLTYPAPHSPSRSDTPEWGHCKATQSKIRLVQDRPHEEYLTFLVGMQRKSGWPDIIIRPCLFPVEYRIWLAGYPTGNQVLEKAEYPAKFLLGHNTEVRNLLITVSANV